MKDVEKYLYSAYCVGLVAMNLLASKQVDISVFTINLGLFIFPMVFTIINIQSDVFGFNSAKNMITTGLVVNIVMAVIYVIAINVPPSRNFVNQEAFQIVLGSTTRISIASIIAYYIGSLINAKIQTSLKKKFERYLFFRLITSSAIGHIVDNVLFMMLAFLGVLPIMAIITMIIGGTIIGVVYEIAIFPGTRMFIKRLREHQREI